MTCCFVRMMCTFLLLLITIIHPYPHLLTPGHFVMRGTGDYGVSLSSTITLALSVDATLLIDMDYANDGVAPDSNGAVDFAMMFSGQMTPVFELDVGEVDDAGENVPMELDFSAVFQVDADFYMVSFVYLG